MPPLRLALAVFLVPAAQASECATDTGGTCASGICFTWRNAECTHGHKCTCAEGSCSENGECIASGACSRVTNWNCDVGPCPSSTNSVCSPKPAFPAPCAGKLFLFVSALLGLFLVTCGGLCVCVFKHKFNGLGMGLSTVGIVGAGCVAYLMYGSIHEACLATGFLHQSGFDVPTVPPDWDAPKPAQLLGVGSLQMLKCMCPQGSCSHGEECVAAGDCPKFTGGSCSLMGCGRSRNAKCEKIRHQGYCVCGEDECAKDGACIPKEEYLIGLGNVSVGNHYHESLAAAERWSARAHVWAAAAAGAAAVAVFAAVTSGRGRGRGREPLLPQS